VNPRPFGTNPFNHSTLKPTEPQTLWHKSIQPFNPER